MTELLYQMDSYLQEFTARVTMARDQAVTLDRTAFYPGGGGQLADTGTLTWNQSVGRVVKLKKVGDDVWHTVDGATTPTEGTEVIGQIDWGTRYRMMRTHTALHILCGVIFRDYGALVTGGNMSPQGARMDFELEHMSATFAAEVEDKVNAEIAAARPVTVRILPREEAFQIPDLIRTRINLLPPAITQVRVVEIQGLDVQADGGTHVANTHEVGGIKVVGHESKGRINKRLRIVLA